MCGIRAVDGMNEADVIDTFGQMREQFTDPGAAFSVLLEGPGGFQQVMPVGANWTRGLANGSGLPSSRVSSGLGSNVSRWDGPPFMNKEYDPFGACGEMGQSEGGGSGSAGVAADVVESRPSNDARASEPNPTALRARS